jgi:hypothetical protein
VQQIAELGIAVDAQRIEALLRVVRPRLSRTREAAQVELRLRLEPRAPTVGQFVSHPATQPDPPACTAAKLSQMI